MGRNCISEVLRASPERIVGVYTSKKPGTDSLYDALVKRGIPVREVSKRELTRIVESDSHQSYVAAVTEKPEIFLKEFLKSVAQKESSIVLMLDSIFDPQNLGAIIRAGECFGVDLIVFSKNRGASITPVTTKTSAGATELVPILKVSNLADALHSFKKEGFWALAAEAKENSQSLYDFAFPKKVLLILGSEGQGIQPLLSKRCDVHLKIPMFGQIDSLNVSQAASVLLHSYKFSLNS